MLDQQCIAHDGAIVDAMREKIELVPFKQNDILIQQGAHDNDIFFILAGRVSIR